MYPCGSLPASPFAFGSVAVVPVSVVPVSVLLTFSMLTLLPLSVLLLVFTLGRVCLPVYSPAVSARSSVHSSLPVRRPCPLLTLVPFLPALPVSVLVLGSVSAPVPFGFLLPPLLMALSFQVVRITVKSLTIPLTPVKRSIQLLLVLPTPRVTMAPFWPPNVFNLVKILRA